MPMDDSRGLYEESSKVGEFPEVFIVKQSLVV